MLINQFYTRLILNIIVGIMFVYALVKVAKHNITKIDQAPKRSANKAFGWLFLIIATMSLLSCLFLVRQLDFPKTIIEQHLTSNSIIRPSSKVLYWGYPTRVQFSILSSVLSIFSLLGLSGYFFLYRKSNDVWWVVAIRIIACLLLLVFMYSATDFHYFDIYEFIAPILFFVLWFILVKGKISSRKQYPSSESIAPCSNPVEKVSEENQLDNEIENGCISNYIELDNSDYPIYTEIEDSPSINIEEEKKEDGKEETDDVDNNDENKDAALKVQDQSINHIHKNGMIFCPHCGNKIEVNSIFCMYCGSRLEKKRIKSTHKPKSKANKSKIKKIAKISILIIGLLVLLTGIGIGISYYFKEILPKRKAEKIFNQEIEQLQSLYGDMLYRKCLQIILDLNIPSCGDEWIDKSNLRKLTIFAWNAIETLAYDEYPPAQFTLAFLYDGFDFENSRWDRSYENGQYRNPNLDYYKAAFWYLEAANQNHGEAQSRLGDCYKDGRGVGKNIREAIEWYRLAASNNNAYGELNLGDLFKEGVYETHRTFLKSVWKKDPSYFYHNWDTKYGYKKEDQYTYSTEVILRANIDSAKFYWVRAAEHGNKEALERLQKIY